MESLDDTEEVIDSTFAEDGPFSTRWSAFPDLQDPMRFDSVAIRIEARGRVIEVPVDTGGNLFVANEELTVKDPQGNLVTRLPTANVSTTEHAGRDVTVTSAHAGTEITYIFRFSASQQAQTALERLQAVTKAAVPHTVTAPEDVTTHQPVSSPKCETYDVNSVQKDVTSREAVAGQNKSGLNQQLPSAQVSSVEDALKSDQAVASKAVFSQQRDTDNVSSVQEIVPAKKIILDATESHPPLKKVAIDASKSEKVDAKPACKANRTKGGCGICQGCLRPDDCGDCHFCKDKPKFGGSNSMKQKCLLKKCQAGVKSSTIQVHASESAADSIAVDVFNTFSCPARKTFQKSLNAHLAQKLKSTEWTGKVSHERASKAGRVLPLPPSIVAEVDELLTFHRTKIDEYKEFLLRTEMFKHS